MAKQEIKKMELNEAAHFASSERYMNLAIWHQS